MAYHVDLEITPDQVQRLKQAALTRNQSVKDFVTELVVQSLPTDEVGKKNIKKEKKEEKS